MVINELAAWRAKAGVRGISKAGLAAKLGVSRSYMTRLEQGKINPSAEMLFRIAAHFNCKVEDIFRWRVDANKP